MPSLQDAKRAKQDEFYTRYEDVENEMIHYVDHLKGKTIYCNCDNPSQSAFFKYFFDNFHHLGIARLIAACYVNSSVDLLNTTKQKAIWVSYEGKERSIENIPKHDFMANGDFRSSESIDLLKQSDIVCTNPPFSLFRQYIRQLMQYEKKFIILGNMNAIRYRDTWPYFRQGKLWLGCTNGTKYYIVPDGYDKNIKINKDGIRYSKLGNIYWYTNIPNKRQNEFISLSKKYNQDDYPNYDNYNAINVNRTKDIPIDYDGIMGVPVSFLEKHNPEQFEIIGADRDVMWGNLPRSKFIRQSWQGLLGQGYIDGKAVYGRIFVKRK